MPMILIFPNTARAVLYRAMLAVLMFTFLQSARASQQDVYDCKTVMQGSAEQKQQAATELLKYSYDTDKLACGARIMIAFADENSSDYAAQLSALQANTRAIYYLDRIVLYELGYLISWYVTEVPVETKLNGPMIALMAAQEEHLRILKQARDAGFDTAELYYYEAITLGVNIKALPLLKTAIAKDPPSLHGAAHSLLAETYYALPDVVGGDLNLAIETLRAARERAPNNPRYAQLLASYLLDSGQTEEASSLLNSLLSVQADRAGWQLLADQLRVAASMAERLADTDLSDQLAARRDGILEQYPFLQNRSVVSAMGHFGDKNPMELSD